MPSKHDVIKSSIDDISKQRYSISVSPESWVLPNRVRFGPWIDRTFKYKPNNKVQCTQCEEGESCPTKVNLSSMSLFPHQEFIKDYMQFASPYRGLLVYHGLGSGKSCSSIAAAEILMNDSDVVVMLPASLRDNYINEVKKCGASFFNPNQHWTFIDEAEHVRNLRSKFKVSDDILRKHKGIWVPLNKHEPNYNTLVESSRLQIDTQIRDIIENRYRLINYNGLQRKTIEKMIEDGKNPFDGKTVIVDEIHNLVSRIVNGRKIGLALYKLLMSATNCKLILLSGTPIINYPFEIAYILNLLAGPMLYHELKANKNSDFNKDAIETLLINNEFIDDFNIDISSKKVTVFLLPSGFHVVNRKLSRVARYSGPYIPHTDIIKQLITDFKRINHDFNKRYSTKETTLLPEKREDFDMLFVDEDRGVVRNPKLFMKRALGTVSYYNSFSLDLFPSWDIEEVSVKMTTSQFNLYEKAREDERKKEGSNKYKKAGGEGLFSSSGQVYRFFSRAVCNFVFPEHIKRPFPSKLSDMRKEIDEEEDVIDAIEKADSGNKKTDLYQTKLEECLNKLRAQKDTYLSLEELNKYSPKFDTIIRNMMNSPGNILLYSQFRKVEGLGVLGIALEANGWAEFKIKKTGTEWEIDMHPSDIKKSCYAAFTGNNEESRILLKIFNNEFDGVPIKIKQSLKGRDNLRGDILKALMITQSGAEGISLKNTRQVHVIEPYWNHIRIDQVIGRAVRTCSHVALPKEERNVKVYIYCSSFTKEQKAASFTLRTLDKSLTSDEYLFNIAKKKKAITDGILEMLQKAAVDCALNAKHHGIKCFSFPVNMSENRLTIQQDIKLDETNVSYNKGIEENTWDGQLLRTKKGNFVVKQNTNEVYDYDIFLESGKVVMVGTLSYDGTKRIIKFAD